MSRFRHSVLVSLLLAALADSGQAQFSTRVGAHQAAEHAGEFVEVCGIIADATHARRTRGSPTYLNFDKPYPDHDFTAVIWGRDREKFAFDTEALEGATACVRGRVEMYRGKAQVILFMAEQIAFAPPGPGAAEQED
jgi:hypothetical protein